ncbi:MAG: hypothetical protein E6Q76_13930 [Rhizobium sp.]|nr:MAG: hypothetical protein E6Q76_13930 [Rhizobium sp.]
MDIEDIRRIEFRPGDRLVLRCKRVMSREQLQSIREAFDRFAPGIPVLVLDGDMSLDVLSEELA